MLRRKSMGLKFLGQQLLYRPTELPVTDHAIAHERFVAEALVVRKINPAPYQDAFLVFVR